MGLKDLFIVNDDKPSEKVEPKTETNKFPSDQQSSNTNFSFPSSSPSTSFQPSNEILNKFVDMYQSGFNGLNQPGYDFYEFFQAIVSSGGIDNPQMYNMAMSMGTAMDKTNTKDKLMSQADFYISEINKVYNQYVSTGNSKKQDLVNQKESENHLLTSDLDNLRSQLEAITNQIKTKESQLSMIDNKYGPLITEVNNKLSANDIAKNDLVSNIAKVKNGINNHIK